MHRQLQSRRTNKVSFEASRGVSRLEKLTTCRILSSDDHFQTSDMDEHWLARAAWVIGTPLGAPVEPEVKSMKAERDRSKGSEAMVGRGEVDEKDSKVREMGIRVLTLPHTRERARQIQCERKRRGEDRNGPRRSGQLVSSGLERLADDDPVSLRLSDDVLHLGKRQGVQDWDEEASRSLKGSR